MRPQLYYITDRRHFADDEPTRRRLLLARITEAAAAGVDWIQLREKDLTGHDLESIAEQAVAIVRAAQASGSPTRLLISGRLDIALATGANGVHLPGNGLSTAQARTVAQQANSIHHAHNAQAFLVGTSCHSVAEVATAVAARASLLVFGPVFGKANAPRVLPTGLDELHRAATAAAGVPLLALGSVTLQNAYACLHAGASGIAAIRLFQQNAIAEVVSALRNLAASA